MYVLLSTPSLCIIMHCTHTVPAPIEIEEPLEGILENGDLSFFQFQLPTRGMTIRLEGRSGRTVLYASNKIRNPNSAFFDFRYDSQQDVGGFFVSPDMLGDKNPRGPRNRRETEDDQSSSNTTLYVSIEGVQERNIFTLITSFGNNCKCLHMHDTCSTLILDRSLLKTVCIGIFKSFLCSTWKDPRVCRHGPTPR